MKKIITLIMILVLMVTVRTAAFATASDPVTQEVWASYKESTTDRPVISIDISWDQMSFTYADTSAPAWNPEKHRYEGETTEGGWLPGTGTITIRNNSNAILQATVSYTQEADYSTVDMCFTDKAPYIGSAYTDDRTDGEGNVCGTPCQITVKAIPIGTLSCETNDPAKIGTVSVTVDTGADVFSVLDEVNDRIALCPTADAAAPDRGTVHFAAGTDTQNLYALMEAALAACEDPERTEAERNVAINKVLTAFYGALDIAQ